ncbi:MAG: hypothetical protein OQK24_11730 [Magnetovibrio sp.]|nr:hypothetical protein [Magnetovibrio sp.]
MNRSEISDNGAILIATLTCPECSRPQEVEMLEHACVTYHTCIHCGVRLKAKPGSCCVYCSYADIPCPDAQLGAKSCCYNE